MADFQPTAEQAEAINFQGNHLLIRGVPGSGKTLVLVHRARALAQSTDGSSGHILLVTFNKTLAHFARQKLALNGADRQVMVANFHSWAYRALRRIGTHPSVIDKPERRALIISVVSRYQPEIARYASLARRDLTFWDEEITWIKGCLVADLSGYLEKVRTGRVIPLLPPMRRVVWSVFEEYQRQLWALGLIDFDDMALRLLRGGADLPADLVVDHVLVDEAQDLQASELRLLREIARETLTIAADAHQKIYKTTFTWDELGIQIRGRASKRLTMSFRSTRQIIALAASLRRCDRSLAQSDPEYVEYESPEREGPLPVVHALSSVAGESVLLHRLIAEARAAHPSGTVAVLARGWRRLEMVASHLRALGTTGEFIRRDAGSVETPGLKFTTFHSAKGLEFETVILVGLDEGVFPADLPTEGDLVTGDELEDHIGIERRLLYVSMTRARSTLHLLHGARPSRFLAELDPDLCARVVD